MLFLQHDFFTNNRNEFKHNQWSGIHTKKITNIWLKYKSIIFPFIKKSACILNIFFYKRKMFVFMAFISFIYAATLNGIN